MEKKLITKNDEQIMSCFKKTNDGDKEMIIFTIAKQFYQSMLASKSKNFKMLFWVCTFRRLSQTHIDLLINARQERFFSALIRMNFLCS